MNVPEISKPLPRAAGNHTYIETNPILELTRIKLTLDLIEQTCLGATYEAEAVGARPKMSPSKPTVAAGAAGCCGTTGPSFSKPSNPPLRRSKPDEANGAAGTDGRTDGPPRSIVSKSPIRESCVGITVERWSPCEGLDSKMSCDPDRVGRARREEPKPRPSTKADGGL